MRWQDKLTKEELHHFRHSAGCNTLEQFKVNRAEQKKLDPSKEVCYECRSIALKLGIEN